MNRIRKYDKIYQVLITPAIINNTCIEMLLDNWQDEYFRNFYVLNFETLQEAQCEAFKHPDLDWYRLSLTHLDVYNKFYGIIKKILRENNFIAEMEGNLMKPDVIKETMFERILANGRRFTLTYGLNDIVGFHIVNPWSKNLIDIANILQNDRHLRIFNRIVVDKVIHLTGKTDIGTTYEIKLWPTIMAQWARWMYDNKNNPGVLGSQKEVYIKSLQLQEQIDNGTIIR